MVPRRHRIGTKGFSLLKSSRALASEGLSVRFSHDARSPLPPRIAVVVSSKTAPTAVLRNRLRRLVREAVIPSLKSLPNGFVAAFFVKGTARGYTRDLFKEEAVGLLRKSGYLS